MQHRGITRRESEITDMNEIIRILDTAKVVHIGMVDGDEPYVLPMNYGYVMENGVLTLYLHGGLTGRKLNIMRTNPKIFFSLECDIKPFEGDVACRYGMSYFSILGKGKVEIIEDIEEKKKGLSILMKTQTGRDFEFEDKYTKIVSVMRIDVESYTAKHRPMKH